MANAINALHNRDALRLARVRKGPHRPGALTRMIPLLSLFYACLLPPEVRFDVAGQTIFAYRAVAILLVPWIIAHLIRQTVRLNMFDMMAVISGLWMVVSFSFVYSGVSGAIRGLALALDLVLPYLIARISIKSLTDLRRLIVLAAPGLLVVAFSIFLESVTHTPFVRKGAAMIFGDLPVFRGGNAVGEVNFRGEIRLGLMRGFGPFSHPILAGVFLASLLPLYFNAGLVKWPAWAGIISGFGAFFTMSSAALLGLLIFVILQVYQWFVERVKFVTWRIFVLASTGMVCALQLLTDNGAISYLSQFTLTPGTAYYRRLIWRFGTDSVEANPVFGIGFEGYKRLSWMPESVDAHWLLLAMRFGLLPSLLLFGLIIAIMFMLSKNAMKVRKIDRFAYFGLIGSFTILFIAGFTVTFFGSMGIWFAAMLGLGVSLSVSVRAKAAVASPEYWMSRRLLAHQ